jgi:hypothetical protein
MLCSRGIALHLEFVSAPNKLTGCGTDTNLHIADLQQLNTVR